VVSGLLLIYPAQLADWIGIAGIAAVLLWQKFGTPTVKAA
jgi:hypothetical protein